MEVLTIEHSAFQQLISKIDAMDEFIRKAKLEQQSSLDDDWVDGQAVCEYLCICDKTLQRLRCAGKIAEKHRLLFAKKTLTLSYRHTGYTLPTKKQLIYHR